MSTEVLLVVLAQIKPGTKSTRDEEQIQREGIDVKYAMTIRIYTNI